MIDSEDSSGDYRSSNMSIGSKIKYLEKLKFVSDNLKAERMCKYAVQKLLFVIKHVPDRC